MNEDKVAYAVINLTTDKDAYPSFYLLDKVENLKTKNFNFPSESVKNFLYPGKKPKFVGTNYDEDINNNFYDKFDLGYGKN